MPKILPKPVPGVQPTTAAQVHPSNKTEKGSGGHDEVSQVSTNLALDRLSLVYDLDFDPADLIDSVACPLLSLLPPFRAKVVRSPLYHQSIQIRFHNQPLGLLQLQPFWHTNPFLRIDFNPDRLGPVGVHHFYNSLDILQPGLAGRLIGSGRVTRCDAAIDVTGVHIEDIEVACLRKHKTNAHFRSGTKQTEYFGTRKSGNQLVIYDKASQLTKLGHPAPSQPITRLEMRLKPKCSLQQLPTLKNPFLRILLAQEAQLDHLPEPPHVREWFRDSCRVRGLQNAIKLVPKWKQKEYVDALSSTQPWWWRPLEIWTPWPQVIKDLGLLSYSGHPAVQAHIDSLYVNLSSYS